MGDHHIPTDRRHASVSSSAVHHSHHHHHHHQHQQQQQQQHHHPRHQGDGGGGGMGGGGPGGGGGGGAQRKEIYTYKAPWTVFAMAWSHRPEPDTQFRLAIGSYVEQYSNTVSVVKKRPPDDSSSASSVGRGGGGRRGRGAPDSGDNEDDEDGSNHHAGGGSGGDNLIYKACEFDHPYPCTKILWSPDAGSSGAGGGGRGGGGGSSNLGARDLLATTGDYLRIWSVADDGSGRGTLTPTKEALLNNNKNSEYCAPLTSFDWNEADPTVVGTSSIDTTCTIWDVQSQTARTQLIAHDREVFDLAFAPRGRDVFASVGADGSVRMFDLRSLEHSTIVYESRNLDPLLRLEWNRQDPNYLATFAVDSRRTVVLDIRVPSAPAAELGGHAGCVNAVAWAPHSSCHICTAGDDSQALIWDLSSMTQRPVEDPILAYGAEGEINNLQWSSSQPDWISIAFGDKLQILRV